MVVCVVLDDSCLFTLINIYEQKKYDEHLHVVNSSTLGIFGTIFDNG